MASITGTLADDLITPEGASPGVTGGVPGLANDTISGLGGNDTLSGGGGRDQLLGGDGNDRLEVGPGDAVGDFLSGGNDDDLLLGGTLPLLPGWSPNTLDGGAGNDTLNGFGSLANRADYGTRLLAVAVDLGLGTATLGAEVDTLIAIRAVRGTALADSFVGTAADEIVLPGAGNDLVDLGGGIDMVSYQPATAAVAVDLLAGTGGGTSEGLDTLAGVENVTGGNFNDTLRGDAGANEFRPLSGFDLVDGREGEDWVSYVTWWNGTNGVTSTPGTGNADPDTGVPFAGVEVNLALQFAIDQWGFRDTLVSIEHAAGSPRADILTGALRPEGAPSYLRGFAGNDLLRAERPGTGATADYAEDPAGVRVNLSGGDAVLGGVRLAGGTARDGWGDTDVLVNIDAVRGSAFRDHIIGSAWADRLEGGAGNDTLAGGRPGEVDGGNLLLGGAGRDLLIATGIGDTLDGGQGRDTLRIEAAFGTMTTIRKFQAGTDRIEFHAAEFGVGPGTDLAATGRFAANAAGAATSAAGIGQFVYDTDDRVLLWDADGAGAGAAQLVVLFQGGGAPGAGDIQLIG